MVLHNQLMVLRHQAMVLHHQAIVYGSTHCLQYVRISLLARREPVELIH